MPEKNRPNIEFVAGLLGLIVGVYLLELIAPEQLLSHGLVPRTEWGLLGIVTMPFLHASLAHLLGNLAPLATLLLFMLVFHARRLIEIVIMLILLGGLLLWLFGRPAIHVGASGLIYGLAGFMIVAGFARRRFVEVIGAIAVAVIYGNALVWGMLPLQPGISWDGHLAGAVAGAMTGLASGSGLERPQAK
jgi:membrane associated rhomboid family serine protease